MNNDFNGRYKKISTSVNVLGLGLILAAISWLSSTVIDHGNKLAAINSNRFTSSDGLSVWREIAKIEESLAGIPKQIPPQWFREEIKEMKKDIKELEKTVHENQNMLIRLTKHEN